MARSEREHKRQETLIRGVSSLLFRVITIHKSPIEVRGKGLLSGCWEKIFSIFFPQYLEETSRSDPNMLSIPKHLEVSLENCSDEKIIGQLRVVGYQFI